MALRLTCEHLFDGMDPWPYFLTNMNDLNWAGRHLMEAAVFGSVYPSERFHKPPDQLSTRSPSVSGDNL